LIRRILVIEDDPDVATVLEFALTAGFMAQVDVAPDGDRGVVAARSADYDLILCDLMLPVVDGLEVARRLKLDASPVRAPLIFVSAANNLAFRERRPQDYGAVGALSKPVDLRTICSDLRQMLGQAD
jgi:CheY-like chemotaxis protein